MYIYIYIIIHTTPTHVLNPHYRVTHYIGFFLYRSRFDWQLILSYGKQGSEKFWFIRWHEHHTKRTTNIPDFYRWHPVRLPSCRFHIDPMMACKPMPFLCAPWCDYALQMPAETRLNSCYDTNNRWKIIWYLKVCISSTLQTKTNRNYWWHTVKNYSV